MSDMIIKSANIINPNEEISGVHDIYIKDGKICGIDEDNTKLSSPIIIDADDCFVCPGLIDLSVRLGFVDVPPPPPYEPVIWSFPSDPIVNTFVPVVTDPADTTEGIFNVPSTALLPESIIFFQFGIIFLFAVGYLW